MPVTFYGKWSLDVIGNVGEFPQRMVISGSISSDGIVSGAVGTQVAAVDGAAWTLTMQRSEDGGLTWIENLVQRIPSVTTSSGLIVTLYGDDSVVPPLDSDVTAQFAYLNPQVNPQGPVPPPYSYTLPAGQFWPMPPPRICRCCCESPLQLRRTQDAEANPLRVLKKRSTSLRSSDGQFIATVIGAVSSPLQRHRRRKAPVFRSVEALPGGGSRLSMTNSLWTSAKIHGPLFDGDWFAISHSTFSWLSVAEEMFGFCLFFSANDGLWMSQHRGSNPMGGSKVFSAIPSVLGRRSRGSCFNSEKTRPSVDPARHFPGSFQR